MNHPSIGDFVQNAFDFGEVVRLTPDWVLVESNEKPEGRWVSRDAFDDGIWWVSA